LTLSQINNKQNVIQLICHVFWYGNGSNQLNNNFAFWWTFL
jgi:hypothetical protein